MLAMIINKAVLGELVHSSYTALRCYYSNTSYSARYELMARVWGRCVQKISRVIHEMDLEELLFLKPKLSSGPTPVGRFVYQMLPKSSGHVHSVRKN